jgi:hypothetical protein
VVSFTLVVGEFLVKSSVLSLSIMWSQVWIGDYERLFIE